MLLKKYGRGRTFLELSQMKPAKEGKANSKFIFAFRLSRSGFLQNGAEVGLFSHMLM